MKSRFLLLLLTILVILALVAGLSFTAGPIINDGSNSTTTESLRCEWTASGDTTQTNLTWYVDGSSFLNVTGATSPNTVSSSNTERGQLWNCSVIIFNGTDTLTASDTIRIVNANPNALQIFNESDDDIGNFTVIDEDDPRTFNVTTTDPDGDKISYSAIDLPSGATFTSATGVMQWTATESDIGNHTITFIALDNQTPERGSTAKDVTFQVVEVNDDPTFNPSLTNQTATEGQTFTYNLVAQDEEDDFPINFAMNTSLSSLIINTTGNTTAVISFTTGAPVFSDKGNHTVNITITDTRNGTTTSSFNLEVISVNQLPDIGNLSITTGIQGGTFNALTNASDLDVNDTLTFGISSVSCPVSNPWNITKTGQSSSGSQTVANATINETMTNDHIICNVINITASDGKETASQVFTLNLTNTNDAPVIYNISNSASNTGGDNISNQVTYTQASYVYQVNGSDIDESTDEGENLTFSDNTTLFEISTSGLISFTPNSSIIGNHSILITLSDDEGLNDTRVLNLDVRNNSQPVIDDSGTISCSEDIPCTHLITATDADGDDITFTSNNTQIFNITAFNQTAAILNKTYLQADIGDYSILITATDLRGAQDTSTINFSINNTNDDPVLDTITFPTIVATHKVLLDITSDDEDIDLLGGVELLNYSSVFTSGSSLFNITTLFDNTTNSSTGRIQFTPAINEVGNYTVNISVSDPQGALDWQVISFDVFNDTNAPNISQIRPYGLPFSNSTVFSFRNTSDFSGTNTTINLTENMTILFNHTTTDDTTAQENLTFTWQLDGTNISTNRSLNRYFNFFTAGTRTLRLLVEDDRFENSTWDWILNISNVNRPPVLHNDIENVSISSTETFTNFLYLRNNLKFLDADDDLDSDQTIDANETNTLTFTATSCSVAELTITGATVKFTPEEVGTCFVNFTATDTVGASLQSNRILVNVTNVPNGTETETTTTVTTTVSSGGGGGGGSAIPIPIERDVEVPSPINIIAPEEVTIYRNRTISVPVIIENTLNYTITGIDVGAYSNHSEVSLSFDNNHFDEIEPEARERIILTATGYRLGDNFEIVVNASVQDPEFSDSALILFNSIEQTSTGEEVRVLVTFARDLLTKNEECQELQEILDRADQEVSRNNFNEASRLVDTVINGCRYLVGKTRIADQERPSRLNLSFFKTFNWFYVGSGILLAAFIGMIIIIEYRIRNDKEDI